MDTYCDWGYYQYRGHCYKTNSNGKSFDEANKACSKDGGTLAIISDSQEQAFINSKLIVFTICYCLIDTANHVN